MKKRKGFTLIELIVVLAIIAVLIAIAVPKLNSTKKSAEVVAHRANLTMIKNAAALYTIDHPEANGDITEQVKPYLENEEYPKIPSFISSDSWVVQVIDGNIIVEPDYVEEL